MGGLGWIVGVREVIAFGHVYGGMCSEKALLWKTVQARASIGEVRDLLLETRV